MHCFSILKKFLMWFFLLAQISWEQFFNLRHSLCSVINMINVSIWDWSLHVACKLDNCKLPDMYMQNCIGSRHIIKISIRDQKLIINHTMLDQINSSPPLLLVFGSPSVQYVHKHGAHSVRFFVQRQHGCLYVKIKTQHFPWLWGQFWKNV